MIENYVVKGPDGVLRRSGSGPKGYTACIPLEAGETIEVVDSLPPPPPAVQPDPIAAARRDRNRLLDRHQWTISRPNALTPDCRAAWQQWFAEMDTVLMRNIPPSEWPAEPSFDFVTPEISQGEVQ